MLISSNRLEEGSKVFVEGDKIKGLHVENVTEVLKQTNEDRKDRANGFTEKKMFRHIARIPNMAYFELRKKYPEIDLGDRFQRQRAWKKILADPLYAPYKAVSGGI